MALDAVFLCGNGVAFRVSSKVPFAGFECGFLVFIREVLTLAWLSSRSLLDGGNE